MDTDKLIKNFNRCIDWEDKYLYIISLGEKYALLPAEKQTEQYVIVGCQSSVWIDVKLTEGKVSLLGNSDAALVKGLVAIVCMLLNDKTPSEILNTNIKTIFAQLGLQQQLTPARNQGLEAMVRTIFNKVEHFI
ncbi:cysteine desulfuration protein SufE [Vibrio caribbeanicus]|uniref:cysteine desulfuration protein SufE n=1 Tax=Vibrio caribbeanicus TaxID=701175 RepID=UPI002284760E|nr:cysteine desulfuration protein SufE [Vibrio caribbeanicus]MCY9845184.1 cysteine desulfuration protein SufE [Vibrio caribbeanicus]